MKSLLLLSICMMFPAGAVNMQQGEPKRKERTRKIIVTDNDKSTMTGKKDFRIDPDDDDNKSAIIDADAKTNANFYKGRDEKKEPLAKKPKIKSDGSKRIKNTRKVKKIDG